MEFNVGKGNVDLTDNLYDYHMVENTPTNDNFQIVSFQLYNGYVRLAKVGCKVDNRMRIKDVECVYTRPIQEFDQSRTNYGNGTPVTYEGNIYLLVEASVNNGVTDWQASKKRLVNRAVSTW